MRQDPILSLEEDVFDPEVHLAYSPPKQKFTFQDLRISPSETSTPVAATSSFPILSHEGVLAYRRSLFSPSVIQQCASPPVPGTLVLRNAAEHSKFINDFWTHPTTMNIMSEAAGVPLRILMRTEIGHTNIQRDSGAKTLEQMTKGLEPEPDRTKVELSEEEKNYDPLKSRSVVPWHYDSYPYVCVIMLSDTEGMVGGETYIKTGDGVPAKVEGPALGYGALLQGGEVQHLAARALGVKERISTITSYCADVPGIYDSSYMSNVRPYVDIDVLYKQWAHYRLEKMKSEIAYLQGQIEQTEGRLDISSVHDFAEKQAAYLRRTARQLLPYGLQEMVHHKYGVMEVYRAPILWEKAEELPNFEECVASVKQENWMPGSPFWYDLARTQIDIRAGKVLQAQKGRFRWESPRPFTMGDELFRQGLPEMFLLWLDATKMYGLVKDTARPLF